MSRSYIYPLRLTKEEFELLEAKAKQSNLKKADYIRVLINSKKILVEAREE